VPLVLVTDTENFRPRLEQFYSESEKESKDTFHRQSVSIKKNAMSLLTGIYIYIPVIYILE
jgi:hypothetical protein